MHQATFYRSWIKDSVPNSSLPPNSSPTLFSSCEQRQSYFSTNAHSSMAQLKISLFEQNDLISLSLHPHSLFSPHNRHGIWWRAISGDPESLGPSILSTPLTLGHTTEEFVFSSTLLVRLPISKGGVHLLKSEFKNDESLTQLKWKRETAAHTEGFSIFPMNSNGILPGTGSQMKSKRVGKWKHLLFEGGRKRKSFC